MNSSCKSSQEKDFIVAPRETCISCHAYSGPKFFLPGVRRNESLEIQIFPAGQQSVVVESNTPGPRSVTERMDTEISRLEKSLTALRVHRNLLSPIHKLPAEMIERIFHEAQYESFSNEWDYIEPKHWHAGQVASQISSVLRLISHSSTILWSFVTISVRQGPSFMSSRCLGTQAFIEKCLFHSKEAPLTIRFRQDCTPNDLGDGCNRLAENAYRWKRLELRSEGDLLDAILSRIPSHMSFLHLKELYIASPTSGLCIRLNPTPVLESIHLEDLHGYQYSLHQHDSYLEMIFASAPRLTRITFSGIQIPMACFVNLPWSHIKHLTATLLNDVNDVLRLTTNVKYLRIRGSSSPALSSAQPIFLPLLETLGDVGYRNHVHSYLTAPSLKVLHIIAYRDDSIDSTSRIEVDFIRRSGCALDELILEGFDMDEPWHGDEFRSINTITIKDPSMESLIRSLELYGHDIPSYDWSDGLCRPENHDEVLVEVLVKVLISRLRRILAESSEPRASRCLKQVCITFDQHFEEESVAVLKQFLQSDEVQLSRFRISIRHLDCRPRPESSLVYL